MKTIKTAENIENIGEFKTEHADLNKNQTQKQQQKQDTENKKTIIDQSEEKEIRQKILQQRLL